MPNYRADIRKVAKDLFDATSNWQCSAAEAKPFIVDLQEFLERWEAAEVDTQETNP